MLLRSLLAATALLVGVAYAADAPPKTNPIVVLGFDGMDWGAVEALQAKGQLPNIQAFRARALQAKLATAYDAESPVVWTTMATGVDPSDHGITDFTVSTPSGPVAVASTNRKVPAIWNMVSLAQKKVAVLGLWATFPAEAVNGVILSDRAAKETKGAVISPETYRATFTAELPKAHAAKDLFPGTTASLYKTETHVEPEDRMVSHFAPLLVPQKFDLMWVYLRGIDVVSHEFWKYWRPDGFPAIPADEQAKYADVVPQKYRAMDTFIGRMVKVLPKETNVFIVSDHGFESMKPEINMVQANINPVLAKAGMARLDAKGVADKASSKVYGWQAQNHRGVKYLRVSQSGRDGGPVAPADAASVRAALTTELAKFTYADKKSIVFKVRDLTAEEKADAAMGGADFAVVVATENATYDVYYAGAKVDGAIMDITRRSGFHRFNPAGVFMAAGPDIDTKANVTGIRIHDITPTLLFGLGLPVAQDFDGKAQTQVFNAAFRARVPLRTLPSYGTSGGGKVTEAKDNQETLEQLRKLGYIE